VELLPAIALLLLMSGTLFLIGVKRGDKSHIQGVWTGGRMFLSLLPLLLLAFTLAGLIQVVVSPELIRSWLGQGSGWQGILLAVACGSLIPGGPYAAFPVIAGVYQAGAGMGAAVAMISGWTLLGVLQVIMGIAFIGVRFTLIRTLIVLALPILAGFIVLGWGILW